MKKILLTALTVALFITGCKQSSADGKTASDAPLQEVGSGDIVYVHVEAVLAQSNLFKTEGEILKQKTENAQKSWMQKENGLKYEAAQLQEKYQKGLITTLDAQTQSQKLESRMASYQSSAQKEAQVIEEENYVFNNRAQELLLRAVQAVNADKKYKLVINANSLIDADTTLNISNVVLEEFNKLYAVEKSEKK